MMHDAKTDMPPLLSTQMSCTRRSFNDNAFSGDSASEGDDTDNEGGGTKPKIKPNDAHKKIYIEATPFIQGLLSDPPKSDADKKADAEQAKAINKDIVEQNKKDGLADETQCQIAHVIFESTAILAALYVERLKKDPKDSQARDWIDHHDSSLKRVNRQNGYPEVWTLEASIFPKGKTGKASQTGQSANDKNGTPAAGTGRQRDANQESEAESSGKSGVI